MSGNTLFDPDAYPSKRDSGRKPRAPRPKRRYGAKDGFGPTTDDNWWIVTTLGGQLDRVHRIAKTTEEGSIITECAQVGRPIQRLAQGVDAYLCEVCHE